MNRQFFTRAMALMAVPCLAMAGLLLVFLLLGWNTAGATPDGDDETLKVRFQITSFTVSGTVTSEATGSGIPGVEVFAWNRDLGTGSVGDTTDSSGHYSVTLAEGNYDLNFNPPCGSGYASKTYKGIIGPPGQTRNVPLTSGHTVSGTVFITDGTTPISNVVIYAFNHNTADGFGLPPTDDNGYYCIGLITGTYDLGFTPPPCLGLGPKTLAITVTQDIVTDVVLPPGFTVAGRITDGASNPVAGVQIYARECYTWTGYGFSPSNADGYYTGTLPLGTFGIQFLPPAGRGLGPKTITDVVSTTAGCPNTNLNVTLPKGFTISGRVTCQGEPVKNVSVHADPVGPSPDCYELDGVGAYTVDNGSYRLPVVSGTYDVKFGPPPATGFNTVVLSDVQVITNTVLNMNFCPLFQKSVDDTFAVWGERRTYQIVLSPEQDITAARLTDTLPSAVTWAGDLSVTSGNASYSDGTLIWSGPLTTSESLTITYGVTVTHASCCGTAAHTDIYTDVRNDAVMDDGQGNVLHSTPAVLTIGHPFGTGSDRTFDLAFGDADNDGDLDLAVGNYGQNQICWNNGDGTFDCENAFGGSNTHDVKWGYMDEDNDLDLVVANFWNNSNRVCFNNGDHTFTCTDFSWCSGHQTSCFADLRDVDKDGYLDIALGNQKAQDLIYFNAGNRTFSTTTTTCQPGATEDLAFGDIDNDDDLDLVVVGASRDFVCINDGTGTFTETRWLNDRFDYGTWRVALGDADNDDDVDIATAGQNDYPIEIYLNNGHGYFTKTLFVGPVWDKTWGLAWGDVDCDGDLDLASGNEYQKTVIYFNDPVTATSSITFTKRVFLGTNSSRTHSVAFGDVDGDGHLDLAVGNNWEQNVIYLNTLATMVQAGFTTSPLTGVAPLTVIFTNTSTGDYTTSLWDFGDGVTSPLKSPTHTYMEAESYIVTLTVSGLCDRDTKTEHIKVDCNIYLPIIMKNESSA
jgi:PKD repeat protein